MYHLINEHTRRDYLKQNSELGIVISIKTNKDYVVNGDY